MNFSKMLYSALVIALLINASLAQQKCRALVIEAGADLGSYEAGVIKAFAYNLPSSDIQWDVFSGISVGAITAVGLNQFAKGSERDMADWVVDLWHGIQRTNVWVNWSPGGIVQGLLFETGIFNDNPLRKYLGSHVTQPHQRMLNIGACDVDSGLMIRYNENTVGDDLIEAVISSASVPAVFPYQDFDDYTFFDGGVTRMMDFEGAIKRCREVVTSDSDIIVDTIMIYSEQAMEQWPTNADKKTFTVYSRQQKLTTIIRHGWELVEAKEQNPDVQFRYTVLPSKKLPDADFPFFFNVNQINTMIDQGYQDGLNAINKGPNVQHKQILLEAYEQIMKLENEYSDLVVKEKAQQEILEL